MQQQNILKKWNRSSKDGLFFVVYVIIFKKGDVLDSLYNSNATYEDVKEYMAMQYKSTN